MVRIVRRNAFGTYKSFVAKYEHVIKKGSFSDSTTEECDNMLKQSRSLNKLSEQIIHRRDEKYKSKLVPKKTEYAIYIRLTDIQIKLYKVKYCFKLFFISLFINFYFKLQLFVETISYSSKRSILSMLPSIRKILAHPKRLYYAEESTARSLYSTEWWKNDCVETPNVFEDPRYSGNYAIILNSFQMLRNGRKSRCLLRLPVIILCDSIFSINCQRTPRRK